MADFSLKVNDQLPALTAVCTYSDGTIQDLTGATVTFSMWFKNGLVKVADAAAVVVGAPTAGVAQYQWAAGDVDTPGEFQGEFHVVVGGKPVSFPDGTYLDIVIEPRVA